MTRLTDNVKISCGKDRRRQQLGRWNSGVKEHRYEGDVDRGCDHPLGRCCWREQDVREID